MSGAGAGEAMRIPGKAPMRWEVLTVAILLLASAAAGCGAARPIYYYTIDLPTRTTGPTASGDPWPIVLIVGHISTSHLYRDDRLIYRTGSNELNTYEYRRWVEPPGEIIEHILIRTLRRSGRYRTVHSQRSNMRGDYILRGRLEDFEEVTGSPVTGRVRMELELYEVKAGKTVWSHAYAEDEPVHGKGVDAVVQALNRNVERGITQVTTGIEQYFAAHPPH